MLHNLQLFRDLRLQMILLDQQQYLLHVDRDFLVDFLEAVEERWVSLEIRVLQ